MNYERGLFLVLASCFLDLGAGTEDVGRELPDWQVDYRTENLGRGKAFGKDLKIGDTLTDIDAHLMGEDHAGEWHSSPLTEGGFSEQIIIPGE